MIPFLGPPHDVHLASAIRQGLVIAWWFMPLAFFLCAVRFARNGDRRGRQLLAWHALALVVGVLLSSTLPYLAGTFAAHGSPGLFGSIVSTGKCLFAPDLFCAWPEVQLLVVPAIYVLLLRLVTARRRSHGGQVRPDRPV